MNPKRHILTGHTRFCLLDANIVAGYYLPESLKSDKAKERIEVIVDAVRKRASPEVFLYIPNFSIAEVFAVFAKYHWARWDKNVKKAFPRKLDYRRYDRVCDRFRKDIHNGVLIHQVELNRYHVLCTDLISPVDAYYEYYRHHPGGQSRRKHMMSAADHLIIGMGIYLARIHGRENTAIFTADHRLANILERAKKMKQTTAEKLQLVRKAKAVGLQWEADMYPQVFNVAKVSRASLHEFFGEWPLPERPVGPATANTLRDADVALLVKLRKQSGVPRDALPYTQAFEDILAQFKQHTGKTVDRHEAWRTIGRVEKKGGHS